MPLGSATERPPSFNCAFEEAAIDSVSLSGVTVTFKHLIFPVRKGLGLSCASYKRVEL